MIGDVYFVGEKVEAPFKNGRELLKGKILKNNNDGTYVVRFEDGDEDDKVSETKIRRISGAADPVSAPSAASTQTFRMGEKVTSHLALFLFIPISFISLSYLISFYLLIYVCIIVYHSPQ